MATTDAQLFMEIFLGSDLAHGRSEVGEDVSRKGKREARSWTEVRPATLLDFQQHLDGAAGLGVVPIRSDGKCRWAAIDVDTYQGFDFDAFVPSVAAHFPFLVVCRSKSGGPHLFMFLDDWYEARAVIEVLEGIAAFLGFGTSEIFPKQVAISKEGDAVDYGNWINLPYFGGLAHLRYGYRFNKDAGRTQPLESITHFVTHALECRIPLKTAAEALAGRIAPEVTDDKPASEALFADGPPCLERIWATGVRDNRNISLSNAAVYLKKAFPTNWQGKLDEYNQKMADPLPSGEVETIKKSYAKKDYKFQCSQQPLCQFCFARVCRERPYGIGGDGLVANNRSLSKFDSNPPIWFLDVDLPDSSIRRVSLNTEQLQNFRLFQRRIMEVLNQCPSIVKQEFWINTVQALMRHVTVINVPEDATAEGRFLEHLYDFLERRSSNEDLEDLLRGLPYRDARGVHFRLRALLDYLDQNRFRELNQNQVAAVLKERFGAYSGQVTINGRNLRHWSIDPEKLDEGRTTLTAKAPSDENPF